MSIKKSQLNKKKKEKKKQKKGKRKEKNIGQACPVNK